MKIEIEKVEKVIKINNEKLNEITYKYGLPDAPKNVSGRYGRLYRLFHCFMGDLYKLFGEECMKRNGKI